MARKHNAQGVTQFSAEALAQLVARCEGKLPPEDQALLASLVEAFLSVSRLLREGRTTIRRLRRLFGLRRSERRSDVFPDDTGSNEGAAGSAPPSSATPEGAPASAPGQSPPAVTPEGAPASAPGQSPPAAAQGGAAPPVPRPPQPAKGHGRRGAAAYGDAEHIFVVHDILTPGCSCPECKRGSTYDLNRPSPWLRFFGQPSLFTRCWDLQQLRCSACGKVFTAAPPPEACGPKYSESAAAVLALVRFGLGTPSYRLQRLQAALGTPIPDATQWDVLYARAVDLYPVYQHLLALAAQASTLYLDDTFARVLQFMGKRRAKLVAKGLLPRPDRTGLFTTGIVAAIPEGQLGIFITGRRHAGENLNALLERRAKEALPPQVMSDALDRNVPKDHPVVELNCLAHARRGVLDEVDSFPVEGRYVIDQIAEVYAAEKACREENLCKEARLWVHQLVSAPVMGHLRQWMTAQLEDKRIEPNSDLGRAFRYMLKRWDKLTVFLRVPGAAIDNNICERLLKLPVLHRKGSLFYGSERGAVVGDIYMSLIRTATLHGQNPFEYLTALMTHSQAVAEAPALWMPWNFGETLAARAEPKPTVTPGASVSAAPPAHPTSSTPSDVATPSDPARAPAAVVQSPPGAGSPSPAIAPTPQAKRRSPSRRRPCQSLSPPPAFTLLMLLCLLVPLAAVLHRPHSPAAQPTVGLFEDPGDGSAIEYASCLAEPPPPGRGTKSAAASKVSATAAAAPTTGAVDAHSGRLVAPAPRSPRGLTKSAAAPPTGIGSRLHASTGPPEAVARGRSPPTSAQPSSPRLSQLFVPAAYPGRRS